MNKLLILIFSSLLLVQACTNEPDAADSEELTKSVNVQTYILEPENFKSYVRVVGTIETPNDVVLSAEVSGRVTDILIEEGSEVEKGDVILKIDDSKLVQEKNRLEAITAQAKDRYDRLKKVYEEDGIGSESDYLSAKYNYQQSKAALESIKVDLANTRVSSPLKGRIESIYPDAGEMASPGMQLIRIIGTEGYYITGGVPARYAKAINEGDEVQVWLDEVTRDTLQSSISYVGSSINPQNRTFDVEVALPSEMLNPKVDMIANMKLLTLERNEVIIISEEFIYSEDDRFVVYTAGKDEEGNSVARKQVIQLGPSYQTEVVVEEGLSFGDELITIGSSFLNDGMRIEIKNETGDMASVN